MRIAYSIGAAAALAVAAPAAAETITLASPDGRAGVTVDDTSTDGPTWRTTWRGQPVLAPSKLGFGFEKGVKIGPDLRIVGVRRSEGADRYALTGSRSSVNDRYRMADIDMAEPGAGGHRLTLEVRAYDDGIAMRYRMPDQPGMTQLRIQGELTEFAFPAAYQCTGFNVGHFGSSHEGEFDPVNAALIRPFNLFDLPLLCNTDKGASFAITEANLHDYAGMYLSGIGPGELGVSVSLAPHPDDKWVAVTADLSKRPLETPWRVVLLGDAPGDLVPSTLVTSLNPPARGDFSWVRPGKYAWDWWSGPTLAGVAKPGTNNETLRGFIDFAAQAHLPYMMVDEGWYVNSGFGGYLLPGADPTKVVPGLDLPGLVRYGGERGVRLVLWMHWELLARNMEPILSNLERMGIAGIKVDFMDRDDQAMVGFYDRLLAATAKHHLMLDLHGAFVPRGTVRTWPHFITQEGVFGAEQNKWSRRVTAKHNVNLAFTRAILGPTDYTPGGFRNSAPEAYVPRNNDPQVPTTRGQALALYLAYYSPFEGISDTPDAYRRPGGGWIDGFDFLQDVPTSWDETRVLSGAPGESIVIARRKGATWYVGAMTNAARVVTVPLAFLSAGGHAARIWEDGATPTTLSITDRSLVASDTLQLHLARAGGAVVRIGPLAK